MAIKKVEAKHVDAAGILFFCRNTRNFLLLYRSKNVVDGSCWCGAGGKIEEGETPEEAARREILEEIGFDTEGLPVRELYTHKSDSLTFYNYLCVVDEQFFPELNWESDGYVWAPLEDLPKPFHYGFQEILDDPEAKDILDMTLEAAGRPAAKEAEDAAALVKAGPGKFFTIDEVKARGRAEIERRRQHATQFHTRLKKMLGQE